MKHPDYRLIYGFVLLIALVGLALSFGLGHVTEEGSYGLMPIVVALSSLGTSWAHWAFRVPGAKDKDDPK